MAAEPFLSEIRIFSFTFAPRYWAQCNGQLLAIAQNQALFSLLGTTYGGNGQTNFALPDLRGRVPLHFGGSFSLGQVGGEQAHTITINEMPTHAHLVNGSNATADQSYPPNNLWADGGSFAGFHQSANAVMSGASLTNSGGSQPHENKSPYLTLNFCIALTGVYPSRN